MRIPVSPEACTPPASDIVVRTIRRKHAFAAHAATPTASSLLRTTIAAVAWACASAPGHATCPTWPSAERFTILAQGAEVKDNRTGLVWARCLAGQRWTGSICNGTVSFFSQEAALDYARPLAGWRVPNRRELSSLADKGCSSPAIDASVFPGPVGYLWTSTPHASDVRYAWWVNFDLGVVHYSVDRSTAFAVRLVRVSL